MVLSVTPVGNNASQPYAGAETYIPDQLIAGNLKLVTDLATISGAAALKRGTVMGLTKFAAPVATAGKAYATGTIVVATVPTDGDTLTVNGTAITFNNLPAGDVLGDVMPQGNQQFIRDTTAHQAQDLAAFLNSSTDANISKMTYSVSASTVTATAKIPGTVGNGYTLATSHSAAFTVPSTLTSGTDNTGTSTVGSITAGPRAKPGKYTFAAATTSQTAAFTVFDPDGNEVGVGAVGTAFVSPQINFTVTAGGTVTAADAFIITVPDNSGAQVYKPCKASAVDGSEFPAAILVDNIDVTAGDLLGGVYLMGEFNGNALILDPSLSLAGVKNAFARSGIFIKQSVSADDPS